MLEGNDRVVLVDAADREEGVAGKLDAHRRGLRHRAISVIVADGDGRLLLQRRAAGKYHSGGQWTNTCCSHPAPGETPADAARRRLREEMGFACPLAPLFVTHYRADVSNGLVENEIVHAYGGRFDGTPVPDPAEVEDWQWATLDEIAAGIAHAPERYSVWFRVYLERFGSAIAAIA